MTRIVSCLNHTQKANRFSIDICNACTNQAAKLLLLNSLCGPLQPPYIFVLLRSFLWYQGCSHRSLGVPPTSYYFLILFFFLSCFIFCTSPFLFLFSWPLDVVCFLITVISIYKMFLTYAKIYILGEVHILENKCTRHSFY